MDILQNIGLVRAIGIYGNTLDLFSLSCRTLGRNVEKIMMDFIRQKNIEKIQYDLTSQNRELHFKLNNLINRSIEGVAIGNSNSFY